LLVSSEDITSPCFLLKFVGLKRKSHLLITTSFDLYFSKSFIKKCAN
jgi:hypothetical protein